MEFEPKQRLFDLETAIGGWLVCEENGCPYENSNQECTEHCRAEYELVRVYRRQDSATSIQQEKT